jgi:hypothetical protein
MAETTYGQWALTTNKNQGSRLSNLTSGTAAGKIKYITSAGGPVSAADIKVGLSTLGPDGVSGIVFPLFHGTVGGAPFSDSSLPNMIGDPQEKSYGLSTSDLFASRTFSVDSITESSGTATATTLAAHNQKVGDTVFFTGANTAAYNAANGFVIVTVPTDKTFTFTIASSTGTAGGTVVATFRQEQDGGAQKVVNAILDTAYVAYNSGVQLGSGLSSMTVSRGDLSLNSSKTTGISGVVNTYSRSYSVTFAYKQSGFIEFGGVAALPDITNDLVGEAGDGPF